MDIIFSVLSAIFIALVLAAAVTFGFIILVWIIAAALALAVLVSLRNLWRRWWFLHNSAPPRPSRRPDVIEGDYKDITDDKP
jgi:hypothetical protein